MSVLNPPTKAPVRVKRTHVASTPDPIVLHDSDDSDSDSDSVAGDGLQKPAGFWYEVGGDWRRWAQSEGFTIGGHLHSVKLNDCRVLRIKTLKELDAFHTEYGVQTSVFGITPDWSRLREEWDGVEISPYQWERRLELDFLWYYGWDCASGVIWRPKNALVTYLGPVQFLGAVK